MKLKNWIAFLLKRASLLFFDSWTIAEKELKLGMRFKFNFFALSLVGPLVRLIPFMIVYLGVFHFSSVTKFGGYTEKNLIVFLLLGTLVDIFFSTGYYAFSAKFLQEKFWQTIDGLLIAPVHKLSLILGVGINEFIIVVPAITLFFVLSYFVMPVSAVRLLLVFFVLLLVFLVALSIGLIAGCADLFNENLRPLFEYLRLPIVFFSCFYYPLQFLPKQLWFLSTINPFFHAANIIRSIWQHGTIPEMYWLKQIFPMEPLSYVLLFAVVSPVIAVFVFRLLWHRLGIQGY